ncbi:MAG TPA: GNAT family protein [Patescibacteria group bacterium]|nr:GNAT family protein [Patescibacteria group bacterium]
MSHPLWPLYDLRLRTDRLELFLPDETQLIDLCRLARSGIHPPDEMPFAIPWSRKPSPRFEREFIQFHWGARAAWSPQDWVLELAVSLDGRIVGAQGLVARDFAVMRAVATGSWLGSAYQRQGIGTEMRAAVLALAFDRLGAEIAETEAFVDNPASAGVSRALGYLPNGTGRLAPDGFRRETERFRMTVAEWRTRPRSTVSVEGLDACLELFGVASSE